MAREESGPSNAAFAINKATQAGSKRKPPLDWDKTTRATYGFFSAVLMSPNYHDKELDLAKSVYDKNDLNL